MRKRRSGNKSSSIKKQVKPRVGLANPDHYHRFKIQPLQFAMENGLDALQMNVIKYVCRYDAKDGVHDLVKARSYLDKMIARAHGDPEWWMAGEDARTVLHMSKPKRLFRRGKGAGRSVENTAKMVLPRARARTVR